MPQPKPEEEQVEEEPPPSELRPPRLEIMDRPRGCIFSEPQWLHSQGSLRSETDRKISNCS